MFLQDPGESHAAITARTARSNIERLDDLKNEAVIDYLISQKADPNAMVTMNNFTPLHAAAIRGHASAVRALLRCKDVIIDVRIFVSRSILSLTLKLKFLL